MSHGYRLLNIDRHGNAAFVRLTHARLDENEIYELFGELLDLARDDGATRVALSLGPQTPDCMYSVFLAKLISLQRRLRDMGGSLKLCECTPQVLDILEATALRDFFDLVPDHATARQQWGV
jgi:anti-anti-sigma regulatory factor